MKSKVKVSSLDNVAIVPSKNNSLYGHICVEQVRHIVDEVTGFARPKRVLAFMPGKIKDLQLLNWKVGQEVEGTIMIKEQLTPFNLKDPDASIKLSGKGGIPCLLGDKPIHRRAIYVTDPNAEDVLIAHTNSEEIKASHAETQEANGNKVEKSTEKEVNGNSMDFNQS